MNISHDDNSNIDCAEKSSKVRQLNDLFRKTLTGGTVVITAGIIALGAEKQAEVVAKVQAFDVFTADNDPWNEHDMGVIEIDVADTGSAMRRERIFWKMDYFDLTRAYLSAEPSDPAVTERVLTIMLASEY